MTPYEAVFGQKPRMGLATKVPRELLDNIMTGTLEEDMLDMLFDPSTTPTTISTHTIPEYRNDEDVEVLNIETNDLEGTHEAELLEINTACSLHVTPENGVQQKLDNLIKTTQNILEIESNTDENT
ncbi:uncharacterized protein LOC132934053 [Metopolophium dirhodum]|uniref:uncharacterized protein LOC132934053 n=1 Tax=Metopolophium dirhodum TaxID=44670 RepID=UPI00298FF4D1|nr:uncharacterized protein LOC132934053 [Metopolophium dirhodum]